MNHVIVNIIVRGATHTFIFLSLGEWADNQKGIRKMQPPFIRVTIHRVVAHSACVSLFNTMYPVRCVGLTLPINDK